MSCHVSAHQNSSVCVYFFLKSKKGEKTPLRSAGEVFLGVEGVFFGAQVRRMDCHRNTGGVREVREGLGGGGSAAGSCQGSQLRWHQPDVLIQRGLARSPPRCASPGFMSALNPKHPLRRVAEPGPGLCGGRGALQRCSGENRSCFLLPEPGALTSGLGITSLGHLPLGPCIPGSSPGHPGSPIPCHGHCQGASTPLQLPLVLPTWL